MTDRLYHECHQLIAQGRTLLDDLHHWGFTQLATDVSSPASPGADPQQAVGGWQADSLESLRQALSDCRRCGLSEQRRHVVFGAGDPAADLVLVGEAPGRAEDEQGMPFVGEAGRLLERILFAMGRSRESVYICNVIKCRPPNNRDPRPEEIATCEPFLREQLRLIRPQLIVALGRFAAQTLLDTRTPIGRLRGEWHEYAGIPLMPTFHPAYLLRNPSGKRDVWEDMKQVLQRLRE